MKKVLLASVATISLFAFADMAGAQGAKPDAPAAAPASKSMPDTKTEAPAASSPAAKPTAQDNKAMPQRAEEKSAPAGEKKADTKSETKAPATAATPAAPATKDTPAAASKEAPANRPASAATKEDPKASSTTGQGSTGAKSAAAAPPAEKRTQIVSAIKQEKVTEVTNVNFNITVGTTVPSSVQYYPMPRRIVEIYPEWDGYDFILVKGRYIVLRPQTHEIVYIIEG